MESLCLDSNGAVSQKRKLKSISVQTTVSGSDNGCFDCNICLESAHDPVVTLCGHLYCWPCIYRWLHFQNSSDESYQQQTCPVCKAQISDASLVPLYGRGTSDSDSESSKHQMVVEIPRRPPPPHNLNATLTTTHASASHPSHQLHPNYFESQLQPFQYQQYFPHLYGSYGAGRLPYLGGAAMTSFFNPTIGMFGEMVLTRIFGISHANLFSYSHENPYPHSGSGSPRLRRQEMHINKSLNRVSIFLLCCLILCLIVF